METTLKTADCEDFADWLSPMLVKELRQGMRSRVFVLSFLLLQAVMIFDALVGVTADGFDAGSTIFWTMMGIAILFVIPMSGIGAVSNEMVANTLELTLLTRLTARRIVFGKWVALASQAALLVCAVLPYAVLRYFLGGVDVSNDLTALAWMLLGSLVLCAFAVGLSPFQTKLTRVFWGFFAFWGLIMLVQTLASGFLGVGLTHPSGALASVAGLVVFAVILIALLLETGASKIAPPAENHATSRRLLAWSLLALAAFTVGSGSQFQSAIPEMIVVFFVCAASLLEQPARAASLYRPFVRWGFFGRLLGRVLYPGWQSGLWFTVATFAGFFGLACAIPGVRDDNVLLSFIDGLGTLLLPVCFLQPFYDRTRWRTPIYIGIQLGFAVLTGLAAFTDAEARTHLVNFITIIPTCGLVDASFGGLSSSHDDLRLRILGGGIATLGAFVVLLIRSIPVWRAISKLEAAARVKPRPLPDDAVAV